MTIIQPSVGRQVWFRGIPWATQPGTSITPVRLDANQPMAATIVFVHDDRRVNLDVIDHAGVHWPMHNVTLVQPGATVQHGVGHACWMPYQLGQAKPEAPHANFDSLARGTGWPDLQPNITMASDFLLGTGQLSRRPA